MNYIKTLSLSKIVYFRDTTKFDFKPGLTFILGRNLQRRGPRTSNGSGKSLLFGVLPNILFDSHPTVTKNVRSVQKQIYEKGSSASVELSVGKHSYVYKKAGSKTELTRDGKNLKSRIARDQFRALIDLSEEEFFSTVYLDSRRTNSFQLGTSAERFSFITALFRLQNLDDIRKHINRCISELNSDKRLLEQTSLDLEEAKTKLSTLPKDAQSKADAISLWLKKASVQAQRLTATQHQWENYKKWQLEKDKLSDLPASKYTVKELRSFISKLDGYEAELRQWTKQRRLHEKHRAELETLDLDDSSYDSMVKRKNSIVVIDKPDKPEGDLTAAGRIAKKATLPRAENVYAKSKAKVSVLKEQLDTFNSEVGEADNCPTCHSELSASTKKAIRQNFELQIEALTKKVKTASLCINAHKIVAEYKDYEDELKKYTAYKQAAKEIEAYPFAKVKRKLELKSILSTESLKKPKAPVSIPPSFTRESLEAELVLCQKREQQKQVVATLSVDKPETEIDVNAVKKLNAEVSEKLSALPELQAKASDRKSTLSTVRSLTERVTDMQSKLEDLPVYSMLSGAYSASGLKLLMIQRIAKALEKNLNTYSNQIFSEDFKFTFHVEDNNFGISVTRKFAGKDTTSDIRHLSGAESRLFIFLFVLALLPLIPDKRRMNILVMDEPDANMDDATREIFRDSLLPRLAKIVPSVVVISPNSEVVPQHGRVYTVVKNNGSSKLVEGMVK